MSHPKPNPNYNMARLGSIRYVNVASNRVASEFIPPEPPKRKTMSYKIKTLILSLFGLKPKQPQQPTRKKGWSEKVEDMRIEQLKRLGESKPAPTPKPVIGYGPHGIEHLDHTHIVIPDPDNTEDQMLFNKVVELFEADAFKHNGMTASAALYTNHKGIRVEIDINEKVIVKPFMPKLKRNQHLKLQELIAEKLKKDKQAILNQLTAEDKPDPSKFGGIIGGKTTGGAE